MKFRSQIKSLLPCAFIVSSACGSHPASVEQTPKLVNLTVSVNKPLAKAVEHGDPAVPSTQYLYERALMNGPWGEPSLLTQLLPPTGGMNCSPSYISAQNRSFSIQLPTDLEDRSHNLIAITPSGRILIIYTPSDSTSDEGRFYNNPISWKTVQNQSDFSLTAEAFDGRFPNTDKPVATLIADGVFIIALVNATTAKDLAMTNEKPTVYATCSIHWTP